MAEEQTLHATAADTSYPREYEEWITLSGGERIFLRPVKTTDGPLILDIFSKLSREAIFFRFLTHIDRLKPELVEHLVNIDYRTDFALAAVIREEDQEAMIAVGRYIRTHDPEVAELTIVVRDDWQGKGVGKAVVSRVVEIAKTKGVSRMAILLDSRNEKMKELFSSLGYPYWYESSILDICDRMEIELKMDKAATV